MARRPTYEALEKRIKDLETELSLRAQMKQAVDSRESQYQRVFDRMTDVYYRADLEGKLLEVSPSGPKLLGYDTAEEMIGKDIATEFYADPQEREPLIRQIAKNGKIAFQGTLKRKDGTLVVTETSSWLVYDEAGKPVGIEGIFRDVSKRVFTQNALGASEEKFRNLYEESPIGIEVYDGQGRLVDVNKACLDIFGVTDIQDVRGFDLFRDPNVADEVKARLKKGETVRYEAPFDFERVKESELYETRKSGTIYLDVMITPLGAKDTGFEGGYLVQVQDVTEAKRAAEALLEAHDALEQRVKERTAELAQVNERLRREVQERKLADKALRDSEEKYRNVVERANDGIAIIQDGVIKYANPRLTAMTGYAIDEAIDTPFTVYVHPDDIPEAIERYRKTVGGKELPTRYERALLHKNGTKIDTEISPGVITYQDKPAALIVIRDISERKGVEESLRASEERYRDLFENANDLIQSVAPDGRFLQVNNKWYETLGYSREELSDLSVWDVIHPDSLPHCKEAFEKVLSGQPVSLIETIFVSKDGKLVPVEGNANARFEEGKPVSTRGIFRDISQRKRAEEETNRLRFQLERAQRLETIGTLAGGIAHDFNNLLMGIQGNVSMMLTNTEPADPHYERLRSIEKLVHSGAKLSAHLLGYARKGKYDIKPIDLNEMLKETAETFGRTRKDIRIQRAVAEGLSAIEADHGQIEQVLLNLFINAGDAMPGGGDLILRAVNVTHEDMKGKLYDPKQGNYILLTVTDTGMGMDSKTTKRIFDPFFTTKEMGRGTGLGLASAYGIVKAHGGYIDVASRQGEGTTFSIYLPASEKVAEKSVTTRGPEYKGTGTVLLVDDEEFILKVGRDLLEAMGYRVLTAQDGREAIEVYSKNHADIDIVILDMVMPNVGGGQVYDQMKRINPHVKALLSSGFSIDGEATRILERGCNGFIQKPFTMKQLSSKMKAILERS